ncbi:hypothetical protein MKY41_11140 [Sporosarcina sp. FSL W7-1349]|uniref:hypothetical protein n=1 Tax=Sporosarcina sp. FSL W7-1349 TaxID=2921561 RepID=UPI0030F6DC7B
MDIEETVIHYLEKHPGASANKIINYCHHLHAENQFLEANQFRAIVSKKLRVLKKKRVLHNKQNAWYLLKYKAQ